MLLQAKEHLESSEAGRGREGFFPRAFRGNLALQTPWFGTSSRQNYKWIHFGHLTPPNLWYFAKAALKNEYTTYVFAITTRWGSSRWQVIFEPGPPAWICSEYTWAQATQTSPAQVSQAAANCKPMSASRSACCFNKSQSSEWHVKQHFYAYTNI